MATAGSISSLAGAFSSLSFSSQVSQKLQAPNHLSIRSRARARPLALRRSSLSTVVASVSPLAAVAGDFSASTSELDRSALESYVKSRLPGGFAAQKLWGTGRRKCAIARVVIQEGTGNIIINSRDAKEYLQGNPLWIQYVKTPLLTLGYEGTYDVFVKAHGGGLGGQAQAISLGIARALLKVSENHRSPLRKEGLLTRDSRIVERKKPGLKKARKAPQFSKR
ncbi:ribosomal protein S9 [Wolffia australiana]